MGKKSKGSGQSTQTTQKVEPWSGVQPHLTELYGQAGNWFKGANTTAPSNWNIDHSLAMIKDRALAGSPLAKQAQGTTQALAAGDWGNNPVLSGQMLSENIFANGNMMGEGNPYLRGMVDAAMRPVVENFQNSVAPSLASQFSQAGRMGSGSHLQAAQSAQGTLGRQLGDISSNLYGGAYESGMNRRAQAYEAERSGQRAAWLAKPQMQLQAAALAPTLAQMDYMDMQQLQNAGLLQRSIQQEQMDEPLKRLQNYSALLQGASGYGTTTSSGNSNATQPYNRISGGIGGGLSGYALGSLIPALGGPMGALLGGLGGLFG